MSLPKSTMYKVVINHEEQYRLIPVGQNLPLKTKDTGFSGSKDECLAYVKKVWKGVGPEDWKALLSSIK